MPQFTYTAIQADGNRVTGTVEAWSVQSARDALKQMHLIPEHVEELPRSTVQPSAAMEEAPPPPFPLSAPPSETAPDESASRIAAIPATEPPSPHVRSPKSEVLPPEHEKLSTYFPLLDTLRLYAGWLLAWYCLVYALGSYQNERPLPFRIPYVEGLFLSPLVLSFTLAAFLFLLLTGIWKFIGKGIFTGLILTIVGVATFVLYRMNVV